MHAKAYRQNGGIGFSIDMPTLNISFNKADFIEVYDKRKQGFTPEEQSRILKMVEAEKKKLNLRQGYRAIIGGDVPTHMGFGSSTAIRLALIEGLYLVNKYDYAQEEVIEASERGGVSGIGIKTYFDGGMVFDIGRSSKGDFVPSSSMEKAIKNLPLTFKQLDMPSWKIGVCIPNIEPKSESEEKAFFLATCPIEEMESHKVLYHILYGTVASVIEHNKSTFADSIREIQQCQWKKLEELFTGML